MALLQSIGVKDLIQWALFVVVALVIYLAFQRRQVRIARHSIVRQIEEDAAALFRAKVAKVEVMRNGKVDLEEREFRAVLDNQPAWNYEEDHSVPSVSGFPQAKCQFIDGQRFWQIRSVTQQDGTVLRQFLSSQGFQETLIWFRRVHRALREKCITPRELLDLWRTVLPLGFAGRVTYLKLYFQDDIDAMVQVINATLREGKKQQQRRPLHYFLLYLTEEDRENLTRERMSKKLYNQVAKMVK